MDFAATFWQWYGQDEFARLLAVGDALQALTFLAKSAEEQRYSIPDCPACEAWYSAMLPLGEALAVCGAAMPTVVRSQVQAVWTLCSSLPESAFRCADRSIFDQDEWQSIRKASRRALQSMQSAQIRPYLEATMLECRKAITR